MDVHTILLLQNFKEHIDVFMQSNLEDVRRIQSTYYDSKGLRWFLDLCPPITEPVLNTDISFPMVDLVIRTMSNHADTPTNLALAATCKHFRETITIDPLKIKESKEDVFLKLSETIYTRYYTRSVRLLKSLRYETDYISRVYMQYDNIFMTAPELATGLISVSYGHLEKIMEHKNVTMHVLKAILKNIPITNDVHKLKLVVAILQQILRSVQHYVSVYRVPIHTILIQRLGRDIAVLKEVQERFFMDMIVVTDRNVLEGFLLNSFLVLSWIKKLHIESVNQVLTTAVMGMCTKIAGINTWMQSEECLCAILTELVKCYK